MDIIIGLLAGIATGIAVLFIVARCTARRSAWEDGAFWGYQASKEDNIDAVNYLDIAYKQKRQMRNIASKREHRHRKYKSLVS